MNHSTTPEFWQLYNALPPQVRELAGKNFALLKGNPTHPSLRLRQVGVYWSARVGLHYRVLAKERADGLVWFWIGPHAVYVLSQPLKGGLYGFASNILLRRGVGVRLKTMMAVVWLEVSDRTNAHTGLF